MGTARSGVRAPVVVVVSAVAVVAAVAFVPPRPVLAATRVAPGGTVVVSGSEARSRVAREVQSVSAAGPATAAVSALGSALYRRIAADNAGRNIVFSPLSIEGALAMARDGAVGETRAQMDRVLMAGSGNGLDRALNALDAALASRAGPISVGSFTGEVGLRTSNALWLQEGWEVYRAFLDVLARHYGAGVNVVDFAHATEAARRRINAFVSEQTNRHIPQLLTASMLSAGTRLVLTNTVWFKAPWVEKFTLLGQRPFHRADGTIVSVRTMNKLAGSRGKAVGRYGSGPGWKAAELPYLGDKLSMVLIVPDDLASFEAHLDGPKLMAITAGLHGALQSVQMPLWTTRTSASLSDYLRALGMARAFTADAQFDALSPEPTHISAVVHQAFVDVNENGTEATAATAVVMTRSSHARPHGERIVIDRPFVYAIRDVETGTVLFLGRTVDPSERAS